MTGFPLTMSLVILMTKSAQEVKRILRQELSDDHWKLVIVETSCEIVTLLLLNQLDVRLIWFF